jgi:hypothetical protein
MQLQLASRSETSIEAGYACPCGCRPTVVVEQGQGRAEHTCCCGNHFVVGPDAEANLLHRPDVRVEVQEVVAPWGETLEAAWAIGSSRHDP